jgi:protein transport protein SEC24
LQNILNDIRNLRLKQASRFPSLYIAREDGDPVMRMWFLSRFIDDRIDSNLSYPQFLASIREKVQKTNV